MLAAVNIALGAAVIACAVSLCWPPHVEQSSRRAERSLHATAGRQIAPAEFASYQVIYRRDLRKPLFDPKQVAAAPVVKKKPKFKADLIGAVVEEGFAYGIFRTHKGAEKLVSIGQKIEGAELTGIGKGIATLMFHGEELSLKVKEGGK